jgi:transcriptional regulator with XRE-family HTH domain
MRYDSENVRWLLWSSGVQRQQWPQVLAGWVKCDVHRARILLQGSVLEEAELHDISLIAGLTPNDLISARLVQEHEQRILLENLRYLLGSIAHGQKRVLAEQFMVHPSTITRWGTGEQRPTREHLAALCRYFDLPYGTDLVNDPIFLSSLPITDEERRSWLKERIGDIDTTTLRTVFPAMWRLLGGQ